MKLLIAFISLLLYTKPDTQLLIVDTTLKKPAYTASEFALSSYMQKGFPIYATEAGAIIDAVDVVVKQMDKEMICHSIDTIKTKHSKLLIVTDCEARQHVSVVLLTRIEETATSYGFTILAKEDNKRKAQQRLLDFATYLAQ